MLIQKCNYLPQVHAENAKNGSEVTLRAIMYFVLLVDWLTTSVILHFRSGEWLVSSKTVGTMIGMIYLIPLILISSA
jgi:hypothetical protein